ncbi:MAG: phosphoribosylamine--glycine ligase [Candidatus Parcubacteria bacterium]|nr:phosphoribosylamine--glycine ligase [Candidatus Parcubacteria bacterium]
MKVLVVGKGAREHAILKKIHEQRPEVTLYATPGNPGIAQIAKCVPIEAMDVDGLVEFAMREQIDLTIVGPEGPLGAGIKDRFSEEGLVLFGPSLLAAQIEHNKEFSASLMNWYQIPTGWHKVFYTPEKVLAFARKQGYPLVIKNPFPASGKGAFVCFNQPQADFALGKIQEQQTGRSGDFHFFVMEYLKGTEVSIMAVANGTHVVYLSSSEDHKRLLDGDEGPMTGGMGAIAPSPFITPEIQAEIHEKIILRTLKAMEAEVRPYSGVLYAGLMLTPEGPKIIEFNCRFGDPETQAILPLLEHDLLDILWVASVGGLQHIKIPEPRRAAACTVLTAKNYGYGRPETGKVIIGLRHLEQISDVNVFHAGTRLSDDGYNLETADGRVVSVVGLADDLPTAIIRSSQAADGIYFDGVHRRRDIGHKALTYLKEKEGGKTS